MNKDQMVIGFGKDDQSLPMFKGGLAADVEIHLTRYGTYVAGFEVNGSPFTVRRDTLKDIREEIEDKQKAGARVRVKDVNLPVFKIDRSGGEIFTFRGISAHNGAWKLTRLGKKSTEKFHGGNILISTKHDQADFIKSRVKRVNEALEELQDARDELWKMAEDIGFPVPSTSFIHQDIKTAAERTADIAAAVEESIS